VVAVHNARPRAQRRRCPAPERFVLKPRTPPKLPTAAWINKPKEVAAQAFSDAKRLTELDRLRPTFEATISSIEPSTIRPKKMVAGWVHTQPGTNVRQFRVQCETV
jgi:hypothetical protein